MAFFHKECKKESNNLWGYSEATMVLRETSKFMSNTKVVTKLAGFKIPPSIISEAYWEQDF
jgi:hypothetical protein